MKLTIIQFTEIEGVSMSIRVMIGVRVSVMLTLLPVSKYRKTYLRAVWECNE